MFYLLVENSLNTVEYSELINDLGGDRKKIECVKLSQSASSHYDFYKVCEHLIIADTRLKRTDFLVVCANVDDATLSFILLKYADTIKFNLKVENKVFLNEHEVFLIYKLGRYFDYSSHRKSTREKEILDLQESLLSSLKKKLIT